MDNRRCLTLQEPWASLVIGRPGLVPLKPVENRTWTTAWRGRLWIHRGKAWDVKGAVSMMKWANLPPPWQAWIEERLRMKTKDREADGMRIVGFVDLNRIIQNHASLYAVPGCYHWCMDNPTMTHPEPCPGAQGLWIAGNQLLATA